MRITNKIMQNNSLSNINTNKLSQDKLNTMMSTQKKITKPSDDPVIAIRSLRLRSSVSQITQYYEKNAPDAESWLDVTEDAIINVTEVLTDMIKQVTKGATEQLKTSDREVIVEQLKALRDELYSTGNADYAGRFIFTGYRTDTTLEFTKAETRNYSITEQLDANAIDEITHVNTVYSAGGGNNYNILDINDSNYFDAGYKDITEQTAVPADHISTVHRIRLAYNQCADGVTPQIKYTDAAGADQTITATKQAKSYDIPSPYENIGANDVVYLSDTGELLLGEDIYKTLVNTKDDAATPNKNEGEIQITYSKTSWEKGDLRPEHYFACTETLGNGEPPIEYNQEYLTGNFARQSIEYDVGFNQVIQINTTADELYTHNIGREIDDLVKTMQQMIDLEKTIGRIEDTMGALSESDPQYQAKKDVLQAQLDAANKAHTFVKENVETEFSSGITAMQGYLNQTNLALTNCGTRGKKLELIESRLMSQQTTFETLKSNNEDADITEIAIKLNSAELTYEASLMATGKIMQTSLLSFI